MESHIEAFIAGYIFCLIVIILWNKFMNNKRNNYEEYPIKDNGFEHLGKHYNCQLAIKRDVKMILQEAEISHKDTFDKLYDRSTLRANKIRIFIDGDNVPIYGMIVYLIDYKEENNSRYACGGYYRFEFDNSVLLPHPYQESICW